MNNANGFLRHGRQAWRLACVCTVAVALAGCGLAQDVARQAGLPDSVFQVLFADHKPAVAPAPAPAVVAAPAPKHEARRSHHRRHHAKAHAGDKAAPSATADSEASTAVKSADAAEGFTDRVPPPVATSDAAADAPQTVAAMPPAETAAPKAAPPADEHAAVAKPDVPSHASRKQVEEKVYAAIQYCKQLHQQGGLGTYQQTAECMGPRIWSAWHEANYPYMDLIGLYVSAMERGAARLDRHEITEAEFEQEMTRMQNRIAAEEQRRNLPAAQLTNISGTGGLAPTE